MDLTLGESNTRATKRAMSNIYCLTRRNTTQVSKAAFFSLGQVSHIFPAALVEHAPLEEVYIFFDTETYDQIERDVKVNTATFAKNLFTFTFSYLSLLIAIFKQLLLLSSEIKNIIKYDKFEHWCPHM